MILLRVLIVLYIFTLSWNTLFRIGHGITLSFSLSIAMLLLSILMLFASGLRLPAHAVAQKYIFQRSDTILFVLLITFLISALIHIHDTAFSRLGMFALVLIGFFSLRILLGFSKFRVQDVLLLNAIGVYFVVVFVNIDHIAYNYLGFDIQESLPTSRERTATFGAKGQRRGYGLSTEPTVVAFYFNTLGPLALYYIVNSISSIFYRTVLIILFFSAFIFTFSPTLVLLMAASAVVFGYRLLKWDPTKQILRFKRIHVSFILLVSLLFLPLHTYIAGGLNFLSPLSNKLTLQSHESGGERSSERAERWSEAFSQIFDFDFVTLLFGKGVGYFSSEGLASPVNWYLMLIYEAGIIGLIVFILFLVLSALAIGRSKVAGRDAYLIGLIAGALHLVTNSLYWLPFIWVLLSIFMYVELRQNYRRV